MKKLYLSSYKFGRSPETLGALVDANTKAAIIMNAEDVFGPQHLPDRIEANKRALADLGIEAEDLDLRDYFNEPDKLKTELGRFGLIWAVGGNAFVLRRAMRYSGFDQIAPGRVRDGSLVYAGYSAGSVVAARTLQGIEVVDDPNEVPGGYDSEVIWDGLDLIDFSIAPHYRSEHPESPLIEDVVRVFKSKDLPYKAIHDGEAVVVRGDSIEVVGTSI
jgi:dipeptidase E